MWHFDQRCFGVELRALRAAAGLSTRNLARLAGVSQAYVVALEGSSSSRDATGPCPSVEVLVALASALRRHPADLLGAALLPAGPHVLYVVDGAGHGVLDTARSEVADVDVWVTAGRRREGDRGVPHITIHPPGESDYRPDRVAAAIRHDFVQLAPTVKDQRVGVLFSDADATLLGATEALLSVEHDWQAIISGAAWAAGARNATSVCTYELDVLQRMASPLETSLDLISSHDTVWLSNERTTCRGRRASLRVLQRLRPRHARADEWRRTCADHLDRMESSARSTATAAHHATHDH